MRVNIVDAMFVVDVMIVVTVVAAIVMFVVAFANIQIFSKLCLLSS